MVAAWRGRGGMAEGLNLMAAAVRGEGKRGDG